MKIPVFTPIRRFLADSKTAPALIVAMMLFCFVGIAFGASGGDQGEAHATEAKGWVATDTYKVMNFAVLAIVLVFLIRKPMKKALNDRIQGIREQLNDLEAKKKAAEDELANYNQKFQK